jgi:hypothetical protein
MAHLNSGVPLLVLLPSVFELARGVKAESGPQTARPRSARGQSANGTRTRAGRGGGRLYFPPRA